jgi:DNA polymerase-4
VIFLCNILLVDMNSFYASVHQALDPSIMGKPVIVAGNPRTRHGIVLAASYEAKDRGIKTGMVQWEARALCPDGIFIMPRHDLYFEFSGRILQIMKDFTPLVEPFSIDECFLDVSGCQTIFGDSVQIAKQIKNRIREEVGVLCSAGVGPNKLLAKMAAELQKPDGLTVVTKEEVPEKIWPLPVGELFGVGRRTEKKLQNFNIWTIGDLAKFPVNILEKRFGIIGRVLHMSANGVDYSPVDPHSLDVVKSVGNQLTLSRDYQGQDEIKVAILDISENVGYRVRKGGYVGKTVSLTLRDKDLIFYSWSSSLSEYTDITEDIYRVAVRLLDTHWTQNKKVRLVGITLSKLMKKQTEQIDFLGEKEKNRKLNKVCDEIRERFGHDSILRCVSITKDGVYYGQRQQTMGKP